MPLTAFNKLLSRVSEDRELFVWKVHNEMFVNAIANINQNIFLTLFFLINKGKVYILLLLL